MFGSRHFKSLTYYTTHSYSRILGRRFDLRTFTTHDRHNKFDKPKVKGVYTPSLLSRMKYPNNFPNLLNSVHFVNLVKDRVSICESLEIFLTSQPYLRIYKSS